jgi:hypothetical protein
VGAAPETRGAAAGDADEEAEAVGKAEVEEEADAEEEADTCTVLKRVRRTGARRHGARRKMGMRIQQDGRHTQPA